MTPPPPSEDMGSRSSEEDMEFCIGDELSPAFCNCGAYDKIMCVTSLLRKRIVNAVNNELDQYEQPLGFLLRSSKRRTFAYEGFSLTVGNDHSQSSSQSLTHNTCMSRPPTVSSERLVNNILVDASLLLLSKLN
ncbi:hypothetical protein NECAME_16039 [Necator americanus]|uniref:Uncharacterized protein n=1 Tax=Necator americanus TaxID=51031 RepID=W2TZ54_NECAM|nr:hypothetical protein NECAME_16039 [Necator americanus]ETN86954.1 hypothetical protein NECAME_16039 [Necator americanus]